MFSTEIWSFGSTVATFHIADSTDLGGKSSRNGFSSSNIGARLPSLFWLVVRHFKGRLSRGGGKNKSVSCLSDMLSGNGY